MRRINGLMARMLVAVSTMAADIYMTAADVNGPTTSFNGAGKWSNGLPPDPLPGCGLAAWRRAGCGDHVC